MALSMDEQRMLAEIERRLAAQDPGLATRLSSFRRPGPGARFRTTRGKIIGSICTIALLAIIAVTVYATIPFRASGQKLTKQPTATSSSAPVKTTSTAATSNAPKSSTASSTMPRRTGPFTVATTP
jgi:hypothetical protein